MTLQRVTTGEVVETVERLCANGESDHYGEGVTTNRITEDLPIQRSQTLVRLKRAVDRGDLEERPAVKPEAGSKLKAFTPTE